MYTKLEKLILKGYKTVRELSNFELRDLSVLIGPNGAGKSNFISFFRMLARMCRTPGELQFHVGESGGASMLLHDGPSKTREMEARLLFSGESADAEYVFRLAFAADDTFVFAEEGAVLFDADGAEVLEWRDSLSGRREPQLLARSDGDASARGIADFLRGIRVYQFHDTSSTSRMRAKWDVEDGGELKEDGANLAPFLYRLRRDEPRYYRRITETIRLVLPFFADFVLEPEGERLLLKWSESGCDKVFSASQAADGMLRAVALVTLLLRPERELPRIVILDEPELGLHPYAITIVGGLIRAISKKSQVIVATQSASLVDCFEPDDIVVVERKGRESLFGRLDEDSLGEWLENYSISELWEKNVIGGRPS